MKKKLLLAVLALFVCMSLLFVSCAKDDTESSDRLSAEEEAKLKNIEAGKAAIVKFLKKDRATEDMMNAESIVKNLEMTSFLELTILGRTSEFSISMRDSLLYMSGPDLQMYVLMQGSEATSFVQKNGKFVLYADSSEAELPEKEDITEELTMFTGMSFEKLTVEDVEYVDEKFVLSDDFVIEMLVDSMADGEQLNGMMSEEARAEIESVFEMMTYEISCKVNDGEVTQFNFLIDLNASAMQEMELLEKDVDGHAKIDLCMKLSEGGKTIQNVVIKMDLYEQDAFDIDMDLEARMHTTTRMSLSGELRLDTPELDEGLCIELDGSILWGDDYGFPETIPEIVQEYMK
ncbi:MAG: hypothetical protein J6Q82_04165 [Clostridia bacterium]|nr:hypothetical protein [Clostridia bacterium]